MGGQGFLIGRGNLQISPAVLRLAGPDSVLGVCTPSKLLSIRTLRIETGDDALDSHYSEMKYLKVLQGLQDYENFTDISGLIIKPLPLRLSIARGMGDLDDRAEI